MPVQSVAAWLDLYASTPIGPVVHRLLEQREGRWFGFVTLAGLESPETLRALIAPSSAPSATLAVVDVETISSEVMGRMRDVALQRAALGASVIALLLLLVLRKSGDVLRVLAVLAGATLVTAAVLVAVGVKLSLFHILSALLVFGLGVDYAVFFLHARSRHGACGETLHSVSVCALSTIFVFGALACAPFTILRAIGLPVLIGTVCAFLFAYGLFARGPRLDLAGRSDSQPDPQP